MNYVLLAGFSIGLIYAIMPFELCIPIMSCFFLFLFLAASGYAGGGVMPPHDRSAGPHWQPTNVGFMNYYWPYIDVTQCT